MFPIAIPRLLLAAAVTVIAISGRFVAIASRISPPSASPSPRRDESTSLVSESSIPATQTAPAPPRKMSTSQGSARPPNTVRGSTLRPDRLGTLVRVFSPSVENLVAQLTHLPGVGQRTAQRL